MCKTEGGKSPVRHAALTLVVHWRSPELFRIIWILPHDFIFLWMKTPACKNEFSYKRDKLFTSAKTATFSLFCWAIVYYPDKSLVRKVPLCLSRRSHHLSRSFLMRLHNFLSHDQQLADFTFSPAEAEWQLGRSGGFQVGRSTYVGHFPRYGTLTVWKSAPLHPCSPVWTAHDDIAALSL